jgi:hypothetical protein
MEVKTERFDVHLGASILKALDEWRRRQRNLPSREVAIRLLVERVLLTAQQLLHVSSAKEAGARQPKWQRGKSIAKQKNEPCKYQASA